MGLLTEFYGSQIKRHQQLKTKPQLGCDGNPFFCSLLVYGNFSKGACDAGWINYDDTCYLFFLDSRVNHSAALAACRTEGGVLVSPNTAEKQEFLVKYLMRYHPSYGTPIWIGLYQKTSSDPLSDPFRWENGRPLIYTNWGCGEPNNAGSGEDCAVLGIGSNIFLSSTWNDDSCSRDFSYICQKPAATSKFPKFLLCLD